MFVLSGLRRADGRAHRALHPFSARHLAPQSARRGVRVVEGAPSVFSCRDQSPLFSSVTLEATSTFSSTQGVYRSPS